MRMHTHTFPITVQTSRWGVKKFAHVDIHNLPCIRALNLDILQYPWISWESWGVAGDGYPPVSMDSYASGGLGGVAGDGYPPVSMNFHASKGLGGVAGDGYPPISMDFFASKGFLEPRTESA